MITAVSVPDNIRGGCEGLHPAAQEQAHVQVSAGETEGKYLHMLKIFVDLSSKKKKTSASRLGYLPVQTLDPDTLVPDSPRSDLSRAVNKHLDLANLCIEKRLHFHWPLIKPVSSIVTV